MVKGKSLQDMISQLGLDVAEETDLLIMADEFTKLLPESMYMSPYELKDMTKVKNPLQWTYFLEFKQIKNWIAAHDRVIRSAETRKAVANLGGSGKSSSDVTAIRAMVDLDKQRQAEDQNKEFIVLHVPPSKSEVSD